MSDKGKTMNANELADILEKGEQGEKYTGKDMKNAATMLRQQQAEIEALKALNKSIMDDPLQFMRIKDK